MFSTVFRSSRSCNISRALKTHLNRELCQRCQDGQQFVYPTLLLLQNQPEILHNHFRFFGTSQNFQGLTKSTSINQLHVAEKPSVISRIREGVGLQRSFKYSRFQMRQAGLNLYSSCGDGFNAEQFFRVCNLPDTLHSWFLVMSLHVWMTMVKLSQEGQEGSYIRHYLILSMWTDVQARGKVMGIPSVQMKEALRKWTYLFHGALYAYDEGLLSHDRVLAAALWRNMFGQRNEDPEKLAILVEYVRQQIQYLDSLNSKQFLQIGNIKWLPLAGIVEGESTPLRKATSLEEELGLNEKEADKVMVN